MKFRREFDVWIASGESPTGEKYKFYFYKKGMFHNGGIF